jgi:DNA-binding transcriptional LysR family regulator
MENWTELRTACEVAKLGTISKAAEALGLHRATVNRHIDVLEEEFGTRIFIRNARGYALNEFGEDVLRVGQKTAELLDDLAGRIRGADAGLEGEIKLTILPTFAQMLMKPVAEFRREYPNCRVSITASEDLARLEFGEAHIAVRAGPKPDYPDYIVQPFKNFELNLYAHQSYIQQHGVPKNLHEMADHVFVVPMDQGQALPFSAWVAEHIKEEQIAVKSHDISVGMDAMQLGLGIGFMSDFHANKNPDFHRVTIANTSWPVRQWLVTHADLHRIGKVQAMLNHLKNSPEL